MIRRIKYFQAVVRNHSFSEAAEECHISQSAISQQIKALEHELGFHLLERKNRNFSLTNAGEYFYKKSLVLTADYENLCREAARLSADDEAVLSIGYLRCYSGQEFHLALEEFSAEYPDVQLKIEYGNHEELYSLLRTGGVDLVLNDQRRAFSDEYVNLILTAGNEYIEISARNPIAALQSVTPLAMDEFNGPRGDFYKNMFAKCPAGRPGTADEVANAAELLLSQKGSFITGADFLIDGGATASYFYGPLKPEAN